LPIFNDVEGRKSVGSTKNLNEPLCSLIDRYLSKLNYFSNNGKPYMEKVKEHLEDANLALCVGSGITSYFVGDWRTLLNKLLVMRCSSVLLNTPEEELKSGDMALSKSKFTELKDYILHLDAPFLSANTSPLEIGEYLMYDPDDDAPNVGVINEDIYRETFFAEQVRHIILNNIAEKTEGNPIDEYFLAHYKEPYLATLASVISLCLRKDIRHIITYNFDTILDQLLASKKIREKFKALHVPVEIHAYTYQDAEPVLLLKSVSSEESEIVINIYHVHGIINNEIKEPQLPIIFSENSYQSYQQTSLNWSNIRLADIMSRFHTLCIGFSGDDANFRMLRHFLSQREENPVMGEIGQKKEMYLMKVFDKDINNLADSVKANEHQECAYACVKTYFNIINAYFEKQLNTHIVWSDGYDEMAKQIVQFSE